MTTRKIALIGYGEVGRILAEDLQAGGHALTAFDLALRSRGNHAMNQHALAHRVTLTESHADAVRDADLIVSAVTASQTVEAARSCAAALPARSFFLDLNSASPGAKLAAAKLVSDRGGQYVEGAVMASVPPYRIGVPVLLGGPFAVELEPLLRALGFSVRTASTTYGVASATKMCRSVVIKGLEALLIESFTAARHYGVEDTVISSLRETLPGIDWERQGAYFFQRVIEHGRRRSEEMEEVAATVREAGLHPWSAAGTARSQAWIAELAERGLFGDRAQADFARSADWRTEADRLLTHLSEAAKP
jgi:3-hydroxyisobutyrate dehydrogenase-like beta-hydroxyacid dehydrogenase